MYAIFQKKLGLKKIDYFRKASHLCKKRPMSGDYGNSSSLECGSYVMKNDKRSCDSR